MAPDWITSRTARGAAGTTTSPLVTAAPTSLTLKRFDPEARTPACPPVNASQERIAYSYGTPGIPLVSEDSASDRVAAQGLRPPSAVRPAITQVRTTSLDT